MISQSIQNICLGVYRVVEKTGVLRTAMGRSIFDFSYGVYKTLFEARWANGLAEFVPAGSTVIDVGANIGFYTLRFASWVGHEGRVFAFEPEATNFERLTRAIHKKAFSDRVIAMNGVAANRTGDFFLDINPNHPGDHKLGSSGEPVPGWDIDTLLSQCGEPRIFLIKIDVQGAEPIVIEGAMKTIERDKPALLLEIDPGAIMAMGGNADSLLSELKRQGYQAYTLGKSGANLPIDNSKILAKCGSDKYLDILFLYEK